MNFDFGKFEWSDGEATNFANIHEIDGKKRVDHRYKYCYRILDVANAN